MPSGSVYKSPRRSPWWGGTEAQLLSTRPFSVPTLQLGTVDNCWRVPPSLPSNDNNVPRARRFRRIIAWSWSAPSRPCWHYLSLVSWFRFARKTVTRTVIVTVQQWPKYRLSTSHIRKTMYPNPHVKHQPQSSRYGGKHNFRQHSSWDGDMDSVGWDVSENHGKYPPGWHSRNQLGHKWHRHLQSRITHGHRIKR